MNQPIQLTGRAPVFLVALACFALSPSSRAVSPPPDGGYPNGNTAEGQSALASLSSGSFNTAVGFLSLKSNTTNNFNTAIGAGTLLANAADENTATGAGALLSNTSGFQNAADGAFALFTNTMGSGNTAEGFEALFSNISGLFNTANGVVALDLNTTGGANTAIGASALHANTTGNNNTAIGASAAQANTTGNSNTAIGALALSGSTTGSGNIALGVNSGSSVTTASGVICIGAVGGANVDNTCFIGDVHGVTTGNNDAIPVLIDSAGQLGTASSSRRYKTDIKPIDKASESILALKPVSFRYKVHDGGTPQFGLIAEEVAEVNPNLVIYDADGKPYTVRYDAVNAMLLNEFLKEHRKVEQLEKQIETLTAGLQKVSAQLEASRSAPQVADSNY